MQILLKIFELLRPRDVLNAAVVCKHWLSITQCQTIVNKTIANVQNEQSLDFFLKSSRKFNFKVSYFNGLEAKFQKFKANNVDNIIEVQLCTNRDSRQFDSFSDVITSLTDITNLKKLSIVSYFRKYDKLPENLLLNLTELILKFTPAQLVSGTILETLVYYSILSATPNLEKLTVVINGYNCQNVIIRQLKNVKNSQNLKYLKWKLNMNFNENREIDFNQLENLNLEFFVLESRVQQINIDKLERFLNTQQNLQKFYFDMVYHPFGQPYPAQATKILKLNKLRYLCLDLGYTDIWHYPNLYDLWSLRHLKLYLAGIQPIFLLLTQKTEMRSLFLDRVRSHGPNSDLTTTLFIRNKFQFLTNLKVFLFSSHCCAFNQDKFVQAINEHLINLQELTLIDNSQICALRVSLFRQS